MKELGDLKEKLATNTANTNNVLETAKEIKESIKIFATAFVTHEEFKSFSDMSSDHEQRLRSLESRVWKAIGALFLVQIVLLPILIYFLNKRIG